MKLRRTIYRVFLILYEITFNTKVSHIITRSSLYLHLFPPFIHRNFMNICCITTMFKHGISYIQIAFSIPTCTSKRRKRGTHAASNNKCKICFEFRFHDKFSKKIIDKTESISRGHWNHSKTSQIIYTY